MSIYEKKGVGQSPVNTRGRGSGSMLPQKILDCLRRLLVHFALEAIVAILVKNDHVAIMQLSAA